MFKNNTQLLQSLHSHPDADADADADKGYMQAKRFSFDEWC